MTKIFNKLDKFELIALVIKAITGVVGGSLVLEQSHPYITLAVLAIGAGANEFVNLLQRKQNENKK